MLVFINNKTTCFIVNKYHHLAIYLQLCFLTELPQLIAKTHNMDGTPQNFLGFPVNIHETA